MDAPRGSDGCRGEAPAAAPLLEESSSSCQSPAAKAGEPRRTSSSSFGYDESDEEAAGPGPGPGPGRGAEEPHYISTHEIQLSEVEHDMDFDAALAARWDFEDDNVIYSFVDYASFGSADTPPDGEAEPSCSPASEPGPGPVPGRGDPEPDPPCPAGAPRAAGGGHVLLAIGPASRAIKECSDGRGERDSAPGGDMSLCLPAAGREPAKRLLAVPARLQAREPGDYSSGASSAVSELDDADKEVRSLTARAFRSLACPGLDAALPPGSRASSAASRPGSAHRWATYLDLKCGSFGPRAEQSLFHSGGRAQSRALEFVVSRLDGEIAHVETPGPAGPRVLSRLEPLSLSLSRRGPPPSPEAPADASSKKSKVASSLLKNVISKKMRLEHESKMERGEITDTSSPRRAAAGLQRQGSRVSEASSEHTLVPAEEPAEPRTPTPRPEPACQVKKSASEAIKATFLRSQHSAFRSWREREAEKLQQQQQPPPQPQPHPQPPQPSSGKPRCDWRADLGQVSAGKATKMSRLFVPSMQQAPRGPEPGKQATKCSTARAAAASLMRARAPEIRISLGSIAQGPPPFSIAQLLTPQLARDPPRPAASDKVPQFQVRDVRDSKAKAPGPLHQVRDVRKLLKSSYSNRDAPDTPSDRGSVASDQGSAEPRARPLLPARAASPGPGKGLGSPPEGTILVHRTSGRLPVATIAPNKSDPRLPAVLKIVSKGAAPWKQPRGKGEEEARDEGRPAAGPARNALEKLTAAVRSMEELYSFSRHEWKRKSDPLPITGSHVLSLIASQERGPAPLRPADEPEPEPQPEPAGAVPGKAERSAAPTAPARASHDPRRSSNPDKVSAKAAAFETLARERERQRGPPERPPPAAAAPPPPRGLPAPKAAAPAKPPAEATPLRAPKAGPAAPRGPPLPAALPGPDAKGAAEAERAATAAAGPDCGNYLALPRHAGAGAGAGGEGGRPAPAPAPAPGPAALCSLQPFSPGRAAEWRGREEGGGAAGPQPQPPPPSAAELQAAAPAAAYPAALPLAALAGAQPPLLCFSPPSAAEAVPLPLQLPVALAQPPRRVLLDVSTGQLYVVEAPPPPKRRLFDPETGQYVEVPLPLPPPPPLPAPPLALGPGAAYAPTYMLYPGFLPALSQPGGDAAGSPGAAEALLADSPYYVAAGKPQGAAGARAAEGKPVISITSQPLGPRLIAPPSFDGTTMRFVVEHR
ncbi:uncharacterized protein C4orf54 homolog [Alligator mississippiensis]|uniref:uncharacterized protein C4orf54 homolog n=1 Tax=Alligator mississippiensis TaxID=8496 RepID=UPI0028776840|nr:uncharacterized protein C4orf54 homolog [Alligator mississippiensis]